MDTKDARFQEALNELYLSLMKVMRLSGCDFQPDQQLQYIISALSGMPQGSVAPANVAESVATVVAGGGNAASDSATPAKAATRPANAAPVAVRYARDYDIRPKDSSIGFRDSDLDDEPTNQFYQLNIFEGGKEATYSVLETDATVKAFSGDPDKCPTELVKANEKTVKRTIRNIREGLLVREGAFWLPTQPCEVEWN